MPTYEYLCESCGYQFEKMQKMTDERMKVCPECGQALSRLIGAGGGIIIKGNNSSMSNYKNNSSSGQTCCGRDERCDTPPCSDDGVCQR
ncbi:MAG: zinc ribbon domain-containing protein [Candidatus Omnitrophica bacterium]|nr:zinc ribbon domain-containing protein [Candidatus Omnitrophota bacterium]